MPDFLGMMKQAAQLQSKMQAMQEELGQLEVEGTSGGGLVSVRMSAKMDVKGIKIDPSLMKAEEREILEDLLVTALADATSRAPSPRRPVLSPELECVLEQAKRQAHAWGHRYVGTEHLIVGLLLGSPCPAADYLHRRGVTADNLRQELQVIFRRS